MSIPPEHCPPHLQHPHDCLHLPVTSPGPTAVNAYSLPFVYYYYFLDTKPNPHLLLWAARNDLLTRPNEFKLNKLPLKAGVQRSSLTRCPFPSHPSPLSEVTLSALCRHAHAALSVDVGHEQVR